MLGLDIIAAGVGEITVPEANRTVVIDQVGIETAMIVHTISAFVLVALSIFFLIDTFFFPDKACSCRFVDVTEIISAILAMFCGIAYIVTIVVGKSDYFLVVLAAGMFTVFRGIRNIIKSVRVGCFIANRVKRTTIVAPEPPQKERNIIIPKPLQQTQENVAAQNMQIFWTGRFRREQDIQEVPSSSKDLSLVMTDVNACSPHPHMPNFVRNRRVNSAMHPGQVLDDQYLSTNLRRFQEKLSTWDFDVFEFARETKDSPLVTVTYVLLNTRGGVCSNFKVNSKTFVSFLHKIEEGYMDNAYHNSRHAADITQAMAFLCFRGGLHEIMKLTPLEVLSIIIACACHDLAHPGVSNKFLTLTHDEMAIRYNDLHVLEQFSCSLALGLLSKPENNFLADKPASTKREFRKLFIDTVLATDLADHHCFFDQFKTRLYDDGFDFTNQKHRLLVLKLMIKSVDICHPCRNFALHNHFTMLLEEELVKQNEQESKVGLPVTIVRNRTHAAIAKSQIGFMSFLVKPFFTDVSKFLVSGGNNFAKDVLMTNMNANLAEWRRIQNT